MTAAGEEKDATRRFLFVGGCPRSGSRALGLLLAGHPRIAIGRERYNHLIRDETVTPAHFEAARFFVPEPGDSWYASFDGLSFADHYEAMRPGYKDALYRGDNFSRCFEHYEALFRAFPDVRFLHLFRGIHAVAASYEAQRAEGGLWPASRDYRTAVKDWNRSISTLLRLHPYLPLLPIAYETLFAKRVGAERLSRFLELDDVHLVRALQRLPEPRRHVESVALTSEAERYIDEHADFDGYARVLELCESISEPGKGRRTVGREPAIVDKYGTADAEAFDYGLWTPTGSRHRLRGPAPPPTHASPPIVCVGSATTFGRLVGSPFPAQLRAALGQPVANLGIGGVRPGAFLHDPALLAMIRQAPLVLLELCSARGYACDLFVPNNAHSSIGQVPPDLFHRINQMSEPPGLFVDLVYERALARLPTKMLDAVRGDILRAYLTDMKHLIAEARGKVVLVYLSQREPDYLPETANLDAWTGGYPHFVDRQAIELLAPLADGLVTLVSKEGLPSVARHRETGEPAAIFPWQDDPSVNTYYPSQAMHDRMAAELLPTVRRLLADDNANGRARADALQPLV